MNRPGTIIVGLILLAGSKLAAQHLQGLSENPVIKKYRADHPRLLKSGSKAPLLTLPFFEDFSTPAVYPDPGKWADSHAFINNSFCRDPVSIGVATLDAIDENGDVYALTSWPASSDMLTSLPFDLSPYAASQDTVMLSFFYQSGGTGEIPELRDSLLAEFYMPSDSRWHREWFVTMDTASAFLQAVIPVPESYYQNGFRFRFRNYTSVSPDEVAGGRGAVSNADCWNIDYVMLNTQPRAAHGAIPDIAIMEPPRYLLDFYEAVPWLHLNDAQSITRNYMHYVFRNLQQTGIDNMGRNYYTKNLRDGSIEYAEEFYDDFGAEEIIRRNDPFITPFTRNDDSKEGTVEVAGYLITPEGQQKSNDTAKTVLYFRDYYAYDDGTPEYGFGISGPSMEGALLAYRFRVYKTDTLRALDLYFNKARDNFNEDLGFQLCVWRDDGGRPGELIYMTPDEYTPALDTEMPEFKRYPVGIDTALVIADSSVFVGWKQVTDEFLNLGYDVNRDNISRIFVNTTGEWFNPGSSIIPGSLMIRPVFGSMDVITGSAEIRQTLQEIILYPNPASGKVFIKPSGVVIRGITICDLSGRVILQQHDQTDHIDISGFRPGMYQVIVDTGKGSIAHKIIVLN